jgi:hypothetical protein
MDLFSFAYVNFGLACAWQESLTWNKPMNVGEY